MEKINYIKKKVSMLPLDDRMYILKTLKQHSLVSDITQHSDGCRINLDKLKPDVIQIIYNIVHSRKNQ